MNQDEARRVSINDCLRDDELSTAHALCQQADPGDWRIADQRVVRFNGEPLTVASLPLMRAAVTLVPRLLRGVKALENALRAAWIDAESWKREHSREVERHRQTAFRGASGVRADASLHSIAELMRLSADVNLDRVAELLARYQGGEDIAGYLANELAWLRKYAAERAEAREAHQAEQKALVEEAKRIVAEQKGKRR